MVSSPHRVRIALLGPVAVEVDGTAVDIPAGHQRRLLAALAMDVGRTVSTDRLMDLLWGDAPPPSARNSLQSHLTRLKSRLGGSIEREPPGYRLTVADADVDVVRFEQLIDDAARTTDLIRRRELLDDALVLWRTEESSVLESNGLADDVVRLRRRRLAAQVERAATALATDDVDTAEADARSVLRTEPLHEPAVVLLVRALAAKGLVAEADATITDFRDRLAEELGLDPSPALDAVHTALLRGELPQIAVAVPPPAEPFSTSGRDESAAPHEETPSPGFADATSSREPRTRPALPRSSFRGRQSTLDELAAHVSAARCVTVVGPGGVGKTRLALELAHRERRAVVWADLLDARTREDVLGRLSLGAGCGTPTDFVTLSPLAETLSAAQALVVLDNCEQAVGEVAAVVDALLSATRETTVLSTSRIPLGIDGEHVADLGPLSTTASDDRPSAALALFADRVGPELDLDDADRRSTASDVVVALDGLPLALELAARQTRNLGLQALRDRLDDRLALLETARPAAHPAHSDLRSLVRWSTDQLEEADRRAFRWLSVFGGPFTLAQAEALLGPDGADIPAVAASVGRLVEQSLVTRRTPDRFLLLETLRACGNEELQETGETAAVRARHTELVLSSAEVAAANIGTPGEIKGVAALNAMVADLQTVTDRLVAASDLEGLCRLAIAMRVYAFETQRPELMRAARVAYGLLADRPHTTLPVALRDGAAVAAAVDALARGDLDLARRVVEPVLAEGRPSAAQADGWNVLGDIRLWAVDPSAEAAYLEGVRLGDAAGDRAEALNAYIGLALTRAFVGNVKAARLAVEEVERRAEECDSPLFAAWASYVRAEAESGHDPEGALEAFDRAIQRGRQVGGHLVVAAASSGAAVVQARHGDPVAALHHLHDTLQDLVGSGSHNVQQGMLRNVAVLLTRVCEDEAAAILLGATSSAPMYEVERRRVNVAIAALTERLRADLADRRRAEGARMDPSELVAVALSAVEALIETRA